LLLKGIKSFFIQRRDEGCAGILCVGIQKLIPAHFSLTDGAVCRNSEVPSVPVTLYSNSPAPENNYLINIKSCWISSSTVGYWWIQSWNESGSPIHEPAFWSPYFKAP